MKMNTYLLATLAGALSSAAAFAQEAPPQALPPPPLAKTPDNTAPGEPQGNKRFWLFTDKSEPQPFLGLVTSEVPPELSAQLGLAEGFGLLVQDVLPDSPAASAGVQKYDILKTLNDQQLVNPEQFSTLVRGAGKGKEVSLTILRKGQEQHLTARIGERAMPKKQFGVNVMPLPKFDGKMGDQVWFGADESLSDAKKKLDETTRDMNEKIQAETRDIKAKAMDQAERARREAEDMQAKIRKQLDRAGIAPSDILREARPEGGAKIKRFSNSAVTTVDGSKAHLVLQDGDGEIEVSVDNGHRTLKARDKSGKEVFSGPVDTEEQRLAVPEQFRKKLDQIKIRDHDVSVRSGVEPIAPERPKADEAQ